MRTIESLARAFEKANPRAYLDVVWDDNSKTTEMVKSGQAHIAVTGTEDKSCRHRPSRGMEFGRRPSPLQFHEGNHHATSGGYFLRQDYPVVGCRWARDQNLIDRSPSQPKHPRAGFESQLGITGKIPDTAKMIGETTRS